MKKQPACEHLPPLFLQDYTLTKTRRMEIKTSVYATSNNVASRLVMDVTNPTYLPRPDFDLNPALNPVEIREGESKSIETIFSPFI